MNTINKKDKGSLMFDKKEPSNPCSSCKFNSGTIEKHTCPYAVEINDNKDFLCNCCKKCYSNCCLEI